MAVAMETAGHNLQELGGAGLSEPRRSEPPPAAVQRIQSQAARRPGSSTATPGQQRARGGTAQQVGLRQWTSKGSEERSKCWRCLSNRHAADDCYFRRKKCFQCFRYGHTSAAHRAGTVNQVGVLYESDSESFEEGAVGGTDPESEHAEMDAVVSDLFTCTEERPSRERPPILVDVSLNDQPVQMELDTGAAVSVCSYGRFKELWPKGDQMLRPSNRLLRTFSGEKLTVKGEAVLTVQYQGASHRLPLTVVDGDGAGPMLLGRNWLGQIRLNWRDICSVTQSPDMEELFGKYSEVFKDDLGCAKGVELSIPVDPAARPIFYKPRTVPLAYREKVDAELERQIREGLLVPVKWNDWATTGLRHMSEGFR